MKKIKAKLLVDCHFGRKGKIINVFKKPFISPFAFNENGYYLSIPSRFYVEVKTLYPNTKFFRRLFPNGKEFGPNFWEVPIE